MKWFDQLIVWGLPLVPKPIVKFFSKIYIAGSTLEEGVAKVKELNAKGIMATMDLLGEFSTDEKICLQAADSYIEMLRTIDREKLDSNVSLKPTHMGLMISKDFCYQNIRRVVQEAQKLGNFVRIDMEDHTTTDTTIEIYLKLKEEFGGQHVGTVIQAYLRRTIDDINHLIEHKANLRLCKGIYVEPKKVAFKDMAIINESFKYNLDKLLSNGCYTGIATHDEKLIYHALTVIDRLKLKRENYEFQMLLGVQEELREILVNTGHRLRVYVPFGKDWYGYSTRRLKENPRMAGYVFKRILSGGK
ncbi:MAG TPA: proline dehydrogenase [Caldithrix abyssi]|uniref:proline dehydrogenase n=1 Tax=Caldithrix abyssi TaxID=187145 RepID=A0A7V5H5W6_CALAY|nr:proline dehydrogenase [Caldithrix abyssi]